MNEFVMAIAMVMAGVCIGVGICRWHDLEWGSRYDQLRARITWPMSIVWTPNESDLEKRLEQHARLIVPAGIAVIVKVDPELTPGIVEFTARCEDRRWWRRKRRPDGFEPVPAPPPPPRERAQ